MKKFIFASLMLLIVSVAFSQTGTVITDLTNFSTVRHNFENALHYPGAGIASFTTSGVRDTVVIPGVRSTSYIMTCARGESAGKVDSTIITWSFYNETTPVDTVIFARNMTTPSGASFVWWVLKW
jgi:hypothetical protein